MDDHEGNSFNCKPSHITFRNEAADVQKFGKYARNI